MADRGTGTLNVDTSALSGVGNRFTQIAADVRTIFTQMKNTVNQVTSNDSWKGDASTAFLEKFANIEPRLERHLQELEELGPTVEKVSNNYADAEQENVGIMRG
ncbi:MAG: WXG100 family type VII secretion target [Bacilli bacterium]|nr:WXG100 family type VII secretion target [Bacilli bacterium]